MVAASSTFLTSLLLLSAGTGDFSVVVVVEGTCPENQNVFGWQQKKGKQRQHDVPITASASASARGVDRTTSTRPVPSSRRVVSASSPSLVSPLLSSSTSSSPSKRSEDVFGWRKREITRTTEHRRHRSSTKKSIPPMIPRGNDTRSNRRGGHSHPSSSKAIVNAGSSRIVGDYRDDYDYDDYEDERRHHHHHEFITPPNLKLAPRKNELWLPWPLGALRNDFQRFAAERGDYSRPPSLLADDLDGSDGSNGGDPSSRRRIGYDDFDASEVGGVGGVGGGEALRRGKNWASGMLRRTSQALPPLPLPLPFGGGGAAAGRRSGGGEREPLLQQRLQPTGGSQSRYWIKDSTTPMATASSLGKNKNKKGQTSTKQRKRGGGKGVELELEEEEATREDKFDKEVLFRYLKLQASVRLRQLGYVGSDLSVHLPPAAPILLFYYFYPSKQDPLRRLVRYTVAGAAIGWMHAEATKYRRFSPLPGMKGVNVRRPNLPPFLPEKEAWALVGGEEEPGDEDDAAVTSVVGKSLVGSRPREAKSTLGGEGSKSTKGEGGGSTSTTRDRDHHHWDPFQSFGTLSSAYRNWLEAHNLRNKRSHRRRRKRAQETLLAMKENSATAASNSTAVASSSSAEPTAPDADAGYALITGASTGIGRALAVELARYRIPLILVARDVAKLSRVARDIETYYDVPCRVLRADLSERDCAERIHGATSEAGLVVDILVNNAGVCDHGEFIEGGDDNGDGFERMDSASNMIQVNINAATQLSRLYGRDMKERRRGRILFVSSMSGVLPGCPSVAVYAATKAFGKSLSSSLGREMERYGVGVTCLLPGAVKDTSFATKTEVEDAVCFHVPGYAITPELVAGVGIEGLMLGYPEIYPGWHNRAFTKMVMPLLPPRVTNMIGECMWNPWQWGDAMPSREQRKPGPRGFNNRNTEQQQPQQQLDEKGDDKPKTSLPFSPAPPGKDSAPSTSTWKFPRLSTSALNNQMQLPGVAKPAADGPSDVSSKSPIKVLANPVKGAAPSDDQKNTTILPEETEAGKLDEHAQNLHSNVAGSPLASSAAPEHASKNSSAAVDSGKRKSKDGTPPMPPVTADDSSQMMSPVPREEDLTRNGKEALMGRTTSDPNALVLPPASSPPLANNDPHTPSSSTLFGFYDEEKSSSSFPSGGESIHSDDRKNSDGNADKNNDKEEEPIPSLDAHPSMMDKSDYDFHDRRLDY